VVRTTVGKWVWPFSSIGSMKMQLGNTMLPAEKNSGLRSPRGLIQRPEIIVMDEAPPRSIAGPGTVMRLLLERLPKPRHQRRTPRRARAFHTRKLVLNITPTARAWSVTNHSKNVRRSAHLLSKLPIRRKSRKMSSSGSLSRANSFSTLSQGTAPDNDPRLACDFPTPFSRSPERPPALAEHALRRAQLEPEAALDAELDGLAC